jgi:DNA-binding NtrC family response regulator
MLVARQRIARVEATIPLIIVSSQSTDETRAYACGAYVFMRDPFPTEYYRACVAQLLRLNERIPPTDERR